MAPLALLSLIYSGKKKRGKVDTLIILLVLGVSLSTGLSACGNNGSTTTPINTPTGSGKITVTPTPTGITVTITTPPPAGSPAGTPSPTPCVTEIILTEAPPAGLTSTTDGPCVRIGNGYCDGARIYKLYTWHKAQKSAWWYEGDEFTPSDFLAMMLIFEANGDKGLLGPMMEATARNLWGTGIDAAGQIMHQAYCNSPTCEAGIFNFLGAYVESAGRRYNALLSVGTIDEPRNRYDMVNPPWTLKRIGDKVVDNVSADWKIYSLDDPIGWGAPGDPDVVKLTKNLSTSKTLTRGNGPCQIVYWDVDVVYTWNQKYNWENKNCP
jgi:hypothetical protein